MHKIATCCYCGTRAALVMRREGRHELSCSACGAPLHEMKAIPCARTARAAAPASPQRRSTAARGPVTPAYAPTRRYAPDPAPHRPQKRRKPRKGLIKKAFEEIWDVVEDIFD
jgi:hypothetical protein